MLIPPSPHFTPIMLHRRVQRGSRPSDGRSPAPWKTTFRIGACAKRSATNRYRGILLHLGELTLPNVILLDSEPVHISMPSVSATFLVFLHRRGRPPTAARAWTSARSAATRRGRQPGEPRSAATSPTTRWSTRHAAARSTTPVFRRFALQQRHITWGSSPFAAAPAKGPYVFNLGTEDYLLYRAAAQLSARAETRHESGRPIETRDCSGSMRCRTRTRSGRSPASRSCQAPSALLVYGITATSLEEPPHCGQARARSSTVSTLPDAH